MCTILKAAHEDGLRDEPPRLPPRFLKEKSKIPQAPSSAEVAEMLKADGWLVPAIALAAFAGLRMGEVRALEVRDIDFDAHVINISRAISGTESLSPKSGNDRVVPMIPDLEQRLAAVVKYKLPKARVIVTESGLTPGRSPMLSAFKALLRRHGLKERSFHSLRHHVVTELVRRGAGLEAVRTLAGHSSLSVTQKYAHATGDDLRAAVDRLK